MGRNPKFKIRNLAILAAGLGLLSQNAVAAAKAQTVQQTYPMMSLQTELARDADTYAEDKALVETCTSKGQSQATCLCVTHVLKYELTLNEYKAAVRLYDKDTKSLSAALRDENISPQDIQTAKDVMADLTKDSDFSERCSEAKAYYRP